MSKSEELSAEGSAGLRAAALRMEAMAKALGAPCVVREFAGATNLPRGTKHYAASFVPTQANRDAGLVGGWHQLGTTEYVASTRLEALCRERAARSGVRP